MKEQTRLLAVIILLGLFIISLIVIINNQDNLPVITSKESNLTHFSSLKELNSFLKSQSDNSRESHANDMMFAEGVDKAAGVAPAATANTAESADYSKTNVQVEGVDEPDIVKNDGQFIYTVSYGNLTIINAYPPESAKIASMTDINGTAQEIFVNGNKLVIFGTESYSAYAEKASSAVCRRCISPPVYYSPKSFVKVYDISNKESPVLEKNLLYDGSYYDARMIGDYIYVIINNLIKYEDNNTILPLLNYNKKQIAIEPADIYYFGIPDYSYQLTTVLSLNLKSAAEPEKQSYLTGYTNTIYVSEKNIYLTSLKQTSYADRQSIIINKVMIPSVDSATAQKMKDILNGNSDIYDKQSKVQGLFEDYYNKLPQNEKDSFLNLYNEKLKTIESEIAKQTERTVINKIAVDNGKIEYNSRGEVPGELLNQFSMDEDNGYLRVATTTGELWNGNSLNHIYILDNGLNIAGKLEDLARAEKIYSVRFMGSRAYMVTFKSIDPLFVIDLSNPAAPKVLGELKIPGFSDYLHPYDENHIIGIGKDVDETIDADKVHSEGAVYYTAVKGIKMSLFDVSDVSAPKEISKVVIGDRGTESTALNEHKAFLFDKNKEILVIPISLREFNPSKLNGEVPSTYGDLTFEGAYVFNLNLKDGFNFKGRITHLNAAEEAQMKSVNYYYDYNAKIERSLYIGDTLYTLSQKKLKANSLADMKELKEIMLPSEQNYLYGV